MYAHPHPIHCSTQREIVSSGNGNEIVGAYITLPPCARGPNTGMTLGNVGMYLKIMFLE